MNPPVDPQEQRFLAALDRLAHDQQPVRIEVGKFELWCLLSAVQLACRHPEFSGGPARQMAEGIARSIGAALTANDRDLALLFAGGWDPAFDVPRIILPGDPE